MRSSWKVREKPIAGVTFYQVYRTTDAVKNPLETYGGLWSTEAEAEQLARRLNQNEKRNVFIDAETGEDLYDDQIN